MLSVGCFQLPKRLAIEVRNKQCGFREKKHSAKQNKQTRPTPFQGSGLH